MEGGCGGDRDRWDRRGVGVGWELSDSCVSSGGCACEARASGASSEGCGCGSCAS